MSAARASSNTTALKPWEISYIGTHSPSGYAGNPPYASVFVTISDPNTIFIASTRFGDAEFPSSTANCSVRWLTATDNPYGWINTCTDIYFGKWTVEVLKRNDTDWPSATENFLLGFTLTEAVILNSGTISKTWAGTGAFAVGENLGGSCGGSGVCNWGLEDEKRPVLVNQTLIETRCLAGTCE
ncbi:hypothetical protein QBC46DRAFT_252359 [Diplogelasinospora grovesii]|uniref:Uncharacterized protein n=1 Tax=Diplogelasinospora grovesii TaxID=303347 RepID=A0AAN6NFX3_9PEZI|nr:hypothetical protein QBC46DRAFT_252359 [Diplogelasinospora grovesii]